MRDAVPERERGRCVALELKLNRAIYESVAEREG